MRDRLEEADLWFLRVRPPADGDPAEDDLAEDDLDEAERRRAAGLARRSTRHLYVASHLMLRRVLSPYLGVAPADLRLVRTPCPGCGGPHGRPAVEGAPLHFSLSHCAGREAGLVLVGVAPEAIGVDVEPVSGPARVATVLHRLHPAEQAELTSLPVPRRTVAFTRLWTRKEAFLKATGSGLARGLRTDYLGAGAPHRHPRGWSVSDVAAPPDHAAAAVVRTSKEHIPLRVRWLPENWLHAPDYGKERTQCTAP
ncbi:4'-phosphopantetheinyl transferase superfamily protein [Streptomyces sp. RerS4]|uniref:4'-phosphopantetheinyl transferase family protein n=1 Tax=Streptomyces sp. RerS4 TaxID=2942449 RepID=UPI00201C16AB|nr:4'-phosphopantetheinyl transferase superfamily protein [Streptomyces sp. RerS4]UQX03441.1 4'-phosphopantetheinyl transferase superfamily protein [Streptomyces sp. RerS4]